MHTVLRQVALEHEAPVGLPLLAPVAALLCLGKAAAQRREDARPGLGFVDLGAAGQRIGLEARSAPKRSAVRGASRST